MAHPAGLRSEVQGGAGTDRRRPAEAERPRTAAANSPPTGSTHEPPYSINQDGNAEGRSEQEGRRGGEGGDEGGGGEEDGGGEADRAAKRRSAGGEPGGPLQAAETDASGHGTALVPPGHTRPLGAPRARLPLPLPRGRGQGKRREWRRPRRWKSRAKRRGAKRRADNTA